MARSRAQLAVVVTPSDSFREALAGAAASAVGAELLPMPQVASRIIALACDVSSNPEQLSELIRREATLAIREQVFRAPGHDADIEDLWRESLAAAVWGEGLARIRSTEPNVAYLCGLLHNVGRVAVLRLLSRVEAEERRVCDARTCSVLLDEFETDFGGQVLNDWNLPLRISSAVLNWRSYEKLRYHRCDATTTHAAHILATATLHPDLMNVNYLGSNPVFAELGLSQETLAGLLERAADVRALVAAL